LCRGVANSYDCGMTENENLALVRWRTRRGRNRKKDIALSRKLGYGWQNQKNRKSATNSDFNSKLHRGPKEPQTNGIGEKEEQALQRIMQNLVIQGEKKKTTADKTRMLTERRKIGGEGARSDGGLVHCNRMQLFRGVRPKTGRRKKNET